MTYKGGVASLGMATPSQSRNGYPLTKTAKILAISDVDNNQNTGNIC